MGRRLALLIATYDYQDTGLRQLTAPAHDADGLAAVLRDPAIAGFEVTTLVNEPHHVVGRAIGDFYRDRRRDDLTLLYFTGHGLKDDTGRLYLAMTDTHRDSLLFTALSAEQIDQAMEGCVSRQKVLILDCCYSGAFPAGRLAKADTAVHALERFQGRGRTVLTASDATQYSFEGNQPHGEAAQSVFTRYLVAGLRDGSADLDGDGDITVDELYSYVHDRVVEEMPQQRPKKQDNVEGRTVIAHNINWTIPAHLRNAIGSPIANDRLGALDGLAHLHRIGNETVRSAVLDEIRRLVGDDSRRVSAAATERLQSLLPQPAETSAKQPTGPHPHLPEPVPEPAPMPALEREPEQEPELVQEPEPEAVSTAPHPATTPHLTPVEAGSPPSPDVSVGESNRPEASAERAVRRSRLVLRTRRAKVLTVAASVLALTVAAVAVFLTTRDTSEPNDPTVLAAAAFSTQFSPDGKILATNTGTGYPLFEQSEPAATVRLWNVATGKVTATLTEQDSRMAFGADGQTLTTVDRTDDFSSGPSKITVRVRKVPTGRTIATTTIPTDPDRRVTFALSADGKTLATGGMDNADKSYSNPIRLWNVSTGKNLATLTGHTNGIMHIAFSPDGKSLASTSYDGSVRLWNVATHKATTPLNGPNMFDFVKFSPDSKTLVTWFEADAVRLWNVATGKITTLTRDTKHGVSEAAFGADSASLATVNGDNTVRLWNVATGKTTTTFTDRAEVKAKDEVLRMVFSPDGSSLAIATYNGTVQVWNVATGKTTAVLNAVFMTFSPDSKTIAITDGDRTVRLRKVANLSAISASTATSAASR
ncbi:caspase family protein [Streptomyces sp. NPDC058457]|uniref:caspase, EACC1-associated type n=1 Tax=Streptomyces sp. NPDC058457 TaxID=3346507 RepID=UPI0036568F14